MHPLGIAYLVMGALIGIGMTVFLFRRYSRKFQQSKEVMLSECLLAILVILVLGAAAIILWPFYLAALFIIWADSVKIKG